MQSSFERPSRGNLGLFMESVQLLSFSLVFIFINHDRVISTALYSVLAHLVREI